MKVFFDFKETDGGKVKMDNITQSKVKGIGKIRIKNQYGLLGHTQ